jgi:copper chaperone CopZ
LIPPPRIQEVVITVMAVPGDTTETRAYNVRGMTCGHCVMSVREEVGEVAGVRTVVVDLASGRMTVSGRGFGDVEVRAAVAQAGYEVAE